MKTILLFLIIVAMNQIRFLCLVEKIVSGISFRYVLRIMKKKGEAVWLLPLSVIDCLFLLYNQFLSVHCVSADDSDVVNATCVVACVKFVCAFCHIVA